MPVGRLGYHGCSKKGEDERTLQADLVLLQRPDGLLKFQLVPRRLARDAEFVPFYGCVGVLEDFLDRVCDLLADTVAGHQSDAALSWGYSYDSKNVWTHV